MWLMVVVLLAAVLAVAVTFWFKEPFDLMIGPPDLGTHVCPIGTDDSWSGVKGMCCENGKACVPARIYQTAKPHKGQLVCPADTQWGWSMQGGLCCGSNGCVLPSKAP